MELGELTREILAGEQRVDLGELSKHPEGSGFIFLAHRSIPST